MAYKVALTKTASRDLKSICAYIARRDGVESAEQVLDHIDALLEALSEYPERGAYPKELLHLGIREFREVFFKAYRVIYRVEKKKVHVLVIADGRRDMQTLLERRLLD
jgi:toxin ParE1/3/4